MTNRGTGSLRRQNRELLMNLISQHGEVTRGMLSKITGLTGAAVSRITRELIDAGLVQEGEPITASGRVGRREYNLSINPKGAYVLGMSIAANRRNISLADAAGTILLAVDCNDVPVDDPTAFLQIIAERANHLVACADFDRSRLLGAGASMAMSTGNSNAVDQELVNSDPLGWTNVPVLKTLEAALDMPIKVEHRASAILRGELRTGKHKGSVYLVNVALGIGVSAYFGDRFLITGDSGFGALSHFGTSRSSNKCQCGRVGCLEVSASGKAILGKLEAHSPLHTKKKVDAISVAIVAASEGNATAKTALYEAGELLGDGIDAVVSILNPNKIILAGEVGRQDDYFAGLVSRLKQLGLHTTVRDLLRSSITSEEAAISVALNNFLFTKELGGLTSF